MVGRRVTLTWEGPRGEKSPVRGTGRRSGARTERKKRGGGNGSRALDRPPAPRACVRARWRRNLLYLSPARPAPPASRRGRVSQNAPRAPALGRTLPGRFLPWASTRHGSSSLPAAVHYWASTFAQKKNTGLQPFWHVSLRSRARPPRPRRSLPFPFAPSYATEWRERRHERSAPVRRSRRASAPRSWT